MLRTTLCDALGIDVPIILAPMGSASSAEFAAAASNEGALGRTEGLAVYELIGLTEVSGENTAWIANYEEGLSRYRRRDFSGAIIHFEKVLRGRPHDWPASLLLERCKRLQRSGVDEEWSPVEALKVK